MTTNNNNNVPNPNADDNNAFQNADHNPNASDSWTQAFNREVAQRQANAMVEKMMAMASQVQAQMQAQMQRQMEQQMQGEAQGFGFPGMPAGMPQGDVLRDSETALIVSLTLPGLQEDSVQVAVDNQQLQVTGQIDATALVPPGFPVPPTLGFTRIVPLPVAVEGDRPTVTTTDNTISIILPKVEPGTLSEEQLRQMATPPMAANPMVAMAEMLKRSMANAPQKSTTSTSKDTQNNALNNWQQRLNQRLTEGRRWMGMQLQTWGDRLSQ